MQTLQVAQQTTLERGVDIVHRRLLADLFDNSPETKQDKITLDNFGAIYSNLIAKGLGLSKI